MLMKVEIYAQLENTVPLVLLIQSHVPQVDSELQHREQFSQIVPSVLLESIVIHSEPLLLQEIVLLDSTVQLVREFLIH